MTKYTRSLQKLVACTKDIFGDSSISIDTRLIVLFLAAVMPNLQFNVWIDRIQQLDHLNARYKEINSLRTVLGNICYQYVILSIIKILDHDINSDELQQFIGCSSNAETSNHLDSPLTTAGLDTIPDNIIEATQVAVGVLVKKLEMIETPTLNTLLDAYVRCRQLLDPSTAYHALEAAMRDILVSSGMSELEAESHSKILISHSLEDLITPNGQEKCMLNAYRQSTVLR
jgi:hypothetical protein